MPYQKNPLLISLATVLFTFLCLFIFFKSFGPIPFFIQNVTTSKESLFTVNGVGEITTIPDTALINVGVVKNAKTVASAQNEANSIINNITKELKALGVEEKNIKTVNYYVNPQYDYSSGNYNSITGYTVNTDLQIKLKPIDQANTAIDIATKNGANQVSGVQFVLDEEIQKKSEEKARQIAINDAKEKAQSIANSAGIKLGRVVDVQVGSNNSPRPVPMYLEAAKSDDSSTQLNPGENKISITVTLSYETF